MKNIWNRGAVPSVLASLALFVSQMHAAQADAGTGKAEAGESLQSAFEVELFNPKRIRPIANGQSHVRLCLMNPDVAIGCDIPPSGSLDLTFPINARLTLRGKYLLATEDTWPAYNSETTGISLWRYAGNDLAIPTGSLQARAAEPQRSLRDYIMTSHVSSGGETSTVFSFNIPREEAYFGLASGYQDSGSSLVESDDHKLNWSILLQVFKDESINPPVCEFIKMVNGSDDCLVPQTIRLTSGMDWDSNFLWTGLPQLSFVY